MSSLDKLGLPGQRSLSWRFRRLDDATPPFVTLRAPRDGEILAAAEVTVAGESEPGATLTIDGRRVPVDNGGRFSTAVTAAVGDNKLAIVAVDPAGNRTERSSSFVYRPASRIEIALDPGLPRDAEGRLLTRADEIDVAGSSTAVAGAHLRVLGGDGGPVVQTLVGDGGGFRFSVPAGGEGAAYAIEVEAPDGKVEGRAEFVALRDADPAGDRARRPAAAGDGAVLARRHRQRRGRGLGDGQRGAGRAGRRPFHRDGDAGAGDERHRDRGDGFWSAMSE